MEWKDISITVPRKYADAAQNVATAVFNGGLYIEDYADMEEQVLAIAHIDLIEQDLLDKPRDVVCIHMYLSPDDEPGALLNELTGRLLEQEVEYTLNVTGVKQEDWETSWKKYYHAIEVGARLAIVPSWEEYNTSRIMMRLDPGMAFGTGTHETTFLCLEILDEIVKNGESVLDIGCGSGILAIAALLLGAKSALGLDIDPMCVRTSGENAALNHVESRLNVHVGDLADKAKGRYDIVTANIVAAAIIRLAPQIPLLLAENGTFIASGIIAERENDVIEALQGVGLHIMEARHKNGWTALVCKAATV